MQRIGILGGAFDPPHVGHLILGEVARQQLALNLVLYLPTGEPPHKQDRSVTPAHHRLAMTRLAIAGNESFVASTIDIDRPAPHFTSTLRPYLESMYPAAVFIMLIGGDSLRDLPSWHQPLEVIRQWKLAVLPRPDAPLNWELLERDVPGAQKATTLLDGPSVALSSTQIRRWIGHGRSLRYVVPQAVEQYIKANALYTT